MLQNKEKKEHAGTWFKVEGHNYHIRHRDMLKHIVEDAMEHSPTTAQDS